MLKHTMSLSLCLMALLALGSAHPAVSSKTLRNKLTPSMALVFQSLHNAAKVEEQSFDSIDRSEEPSSVTKDQRTMPIAMQVASQDWLLANPSGVFGDAESGRLPFFIAIPVAAF